MTLLTLPVTTDEMIDRAIAKADELLVDYETGYCTYDGWGIRQCCTAWGPAVRLNIMDRQELDQAVRQIVTEALIGEEEE